jgi:hypothetical protein
MTALLSPSAQEVADAMAIAFEREDLAASQSPWCPPRDAIVLRRWITDRSRELGGGIRRVVRFARIAALAAGGDCVGFLYGARIPSLRAMHFKAALQAARASGRLSQAVATPSASGVVLHEPAMQVAGATETAGFGIDYAQMPRLAALLDILQNALGYGAIADALEPILGRAPLVRADDVARALHGAFNAWLGDRLDSPHHIRQAQGRHRGCVHSWPGADRSCPRPSTMSRSSPSGRPPRERRMPATWRAFVSLRRPRVRCCAIGVF